MGAELQELEEQHIEMPSKTSTFEKDFFTNDGWVQHLILVVIILFVSAQHLRCFLLCACVSRNDTSSSKPRNLVEFETAEILSECCYRNCIEKATMKIKKSSAKMSKCCDFHAGQQLTEMLVPI